LSVLFSNCLLCKMVVFREFRIIMPLSLADYQLGQRYSVARTSNESTTSSEGVEILQNEPFEDERGKGQYTRKIYHLGSFLPGWLKTIMPASALTLEEKAWDLYPYCKTVLTSPFLGEKFEFVIESKHLENDLGTTPNIHNLPEKKLKKTKNCEHGRSH